MSADATPYSRIAEAIRFLDANARSQPSLAELADHLGCSPFHLDRLFGDWAGLTPKRFLQVLTRNHAREALQRSANVFDAALDSGLSGPGRLHDLLVTCDAVTPGEWARGAVGVQIGWAVAASPFGPLFVAETARGICRADFLDGGTALSRVLQAVQEDFPGALLVQRPECADQVVQHLFAAVPQPAGKESLRVWLRGSNFQIQVWQALLRVPVGECVTYGRLAGAVGRPGAARAVGNALAANRVAALIPCHRVIREMGIVGPYRWGSVRKRALLTWESAQTGPCAN